MAKGDKQRHQGQIDTQERKWDTGQQQLGNTLNNTQSTFMNNYNQGTGRNMGSYDEIMQGYRGVMDDVSSGKYGRPGFKGGNYTPQTIEGGPDPFKSYGGYEEFSNTGGLSAADQANMRARGIAPTRAIYQNAIRQINRQKALQGGYSPNATAALAKNKREMSQEISDANIGVNSDIAKMVQSGRLAGLGGMSGIEGQRYNRDFDIKRFNAEQQNWAEENRGADARFGYSQWQDPNQNRLAALQGMTSLYGATPGMAQLFGSQVLDAQGQQLQHQQNQGNWGQSQIGNQYQNSQIPSNFGQMMNYINQGTQMAGNIGMGMTGLGNIWGAGGGQRPPLAGGPGHYTGLPMTNIGQQVPVNPGRY